MKNWPVPANIPTPTRTGRRRPKRAETIRATPTTPSGHQPTGEGTDRRAPRRRAVGESGGLRDVPAPDARRSSAQAGNYLFGRPLATRDAGRQPDATQHRSRKSEPVVRRQGLSDGGDRRTVAR